tara:strand:- start:123 stop:752 length:630 start_codon:yes stop_codon:yes gene_type:complete
MATKIKLILLISFFIIIQTSGLWESYSGIYSFPIFLFLGLWFVVLVVMAVIESILAISKKLKSKKHNATSLAFISLLVFTTFFPLGLFRQPKQEDENITLQASREGSANCSTNFYLKENNEFSERNICFGIEDINGNYSWSGDTIFFNNIKFPSRGTKKSYYQFAVYTANDSTYSNGELLYFYKNKQDSTPKFLFINQNGIKKQHTTHK